jgi:hypothetical protein
LYIQSIFPIYITDTINDIYFPDWNRAYYNRKETRDLPYQSRKEFMKTSPEITSLEYHKVHLE